jgi:NADH-quinone oxidoreductase subunit I
MKNVIDGIWSQVRSMVMVFSHGFRKRDTLQYPEVPVYLFRRAIAAASC